MINKKGQKTKMKKRKIKIFILCLCTLVLIVGCGANTKLSKEKKADSTSEKKPIVEKPVVEKPVVEEPAVEEPIDTTLAFAGDTMLMTAALANYESKGTDGIIDPAYQQLFQTADIAMLNEEFPLSKQGTAMANKEYTFRINPEYVKWYAGMGIDVVSLANNHALDFGKDALTDTFSTLDQAGINYVGAGSSKERAKAAIIIEKNKKKFGFLSASRVIPVTSWNIDEGQPGLFCTYDPSQLVTEIAKAKQVCDYVVVYVHWGIEYQAKPAEYQVNMAKQYIDAGADLVLGAHPHVLQGFEFYKGKAIVYSMGNFVFTKNIASTMALKVVVTPDNQTQIQVLPGKAENAYTRLCEGTQRQEIIDYLTSISINATVDAQGMVHEN